MATIRKKGKKWQAIIRKSDGYPPAYKCWSTKQEAVDWATQEEARRRRGLYFPETTLHTLQELIDRYILVILPSKPKNAKDTKRHLNWWKSKLGGFALRVITPDMIANLRQELATTRTEKGRLRSPATVNRYLASLSVVFSYGVKECGWVSENPLLKVSKLKESRGRDRILTQEECNRLIASCKVSKSPHLLSIVILAISTGMRLGEILRLKWDDIDFQFNLITLRETKNGRPRSVPLVDLAKQLLKNLASNRREIGNISVFPAKKRFGILSVRKAWDEALKRAGISDLRFHDLRHTFATYAAKRGASSVELQKAMGHQSLQMLDRYTLLDIVQTRPLSEFVVNDLLKEAMKNG